MMIFLFLCLICGLCSSLHLLSYLAAHSKILQETCVHLYDQILPASFVCGSPISDEGAKLLFMQTGLIHLMVVSGGHLQILTSFLEFSIPSKFRESRAGEIILGMLLTAYAFITGFQAPVVRALMAVFLRFASRYFRWSWSALQIQICAGLMLLCLEPGWIFNFSFYLSWIASLGLLIAPWSFIALRKRRHWQAVQRFWLSTFCVQSLVSVAFGFFSPLGLFMNALLAPLLSVALLPLSLLSLFIPWTAYLWQCLQSLLTWSVQFSGTLTPLNNFPSDFARWSLLWIFLASIHGGLWFLQRQRYQGSSQ